MSTNSGWNRTRDYSVLSSSFYFDVVHSEAPSKIPKGTNSPDYNAPWTTPRHPRGSLCRKQLWRGEMYWRDICRFEMRRVESSVVSV